ncbi:MAG: hypothetical protein F9K32_01765 [Desulfobulbaceae bacterium]|nr:MAG: hypothetical protein F9K32_01765 [Desulfobulbaceae bacterium]
MQIILHPDIEEQWTLAKQVFGKGTNQIGKDKRSHHDFSLEIQIIPFGRRFGGRIWKSSRQVAESGQPSKPEGMKAIPSGH